jgi:hypothetical protein
MAWHGMAWHGMHAKWAHPNVQASAASVGTVCRRICDSSVSGSIPPWISSLSRLKSLYAMHSTAAAFAAALVAAALECFRHAGSYLFANQLRGSIPARLAALRKLSVLCVTAQLYFRPQCSPCSERFDSSQQLFVVRAFAATSTQTVSAERCHRPSASCSIWRTCTLRAACVSQPAAVADAPLWQRGVPEHARRDYP